MRAMRFRGIVLLAVSVVSGCTSMLGIDGDYVAQGIVSSGGHESGGGGSPGTTGGLSGNVGEDAGLVDTANGGVSGGGSPDGAFGTTGGDANVVDAQTPCPTGRKRCTINGTEACVAPDPSIGCGLTGCDRCTWPPHGYGICNGDQCDFACISGYVRHGDRCDPISNDGGSSGGGGGTGGISLCSRSSDCPACGPFLGCCVPLLSTCGCWYSVFNLCLTSFQ